MAIKVKDLYEMMPVRVKNVTYGITRAEQAGLGQDIGSTCYVNYSTFFLSHPEGPVVSLYTNDSFGNPTLSDGWYFRLSDLDYVFPLTPNRN